MFRMIIASFALAAACLTGTPALAQQVQTSTAPVPSAECLAQAANDFRSAWQQTAGNPYYDSFDQEPKNGVPDSIENIFAVQAAARACTWSKASATKPAAHEPVDRDPAALEAARREGGEAMKAAAIAAIGKL